MVSMLTTSYTSKTRVTSTSRVFAFVMLLRCVELQWAPKAKINIRFNKHVVNGSRIQTNG